MVKSGHFTVYPLKIEIGPSAFRPPAHWSPVVRFLALCLSPLSHLVEDAVSIMSSGDKQIVRTGSTFNHVDDGCDVKSFDGCLYSMTALCANRPISKHHSPSFM